jgi:hypothetical protein
MAYVPEKAIWEAAVQMLSLANPRAIVWYPEGAK